MAVDDPGIEWKNMGKIENAPYGKFRTVRFLSMDKLALSFEIGTDVPISGIG